MRLELQEAPLYDKSLPNRFSQADTHMFTGSSITARAEAGSEL